MSTTADSALVLGVDASTQSTKVEVRELETGKVVARGSARHPATTPPVSEQDPRAWWHALIEACDHLGDIRSRVVAMSVGGQQHGLVLLDGEGVPVRDAKLWNDTTSSPQADVLVQELGAEQWAALTGSVPVAAFTITKLAWVAQNEPDVFARAQRVMLPHDYLTWRLTGNHVTDRGDSSGTGWFDPSTGNYLPDLLDLAGADASSWAERLPRVLGATETAGHLTEPAAAVLGLPVGILIAPGTGDNMAAALGLGLQENDLALSLGTSGVAYAVSGKPTHDPTGSVAGFADATGQYLPLVCTLNATKVTDTIAHLMGTDAEGLAQLALAADPVRPGPVLVPYFDGERTPNLPLAKGTVGQLGTDTTREQLARAAHDGVLCGLLDGVDALRAAGVPADGQLHLIGGGAKSAAYRQRCADLWQAPIVVPSDDETVATGAALQAAAVHSQQPFAVLQRAWNLGSGETVQPNTSVDAADVRSRYQAAAE